jgi:hypothetical protein
MNSKHRQQRLNPTQLSCEIHGAAPAIKVENGRKRTENRSIVFIFIFLDENESGSRTTGSENGSRINGNTKTGKYDKK